MRELLQPQQDHRGERLTDLPVPPTVRGFVEVMGRVSEPKVIDLTSRIWEAPDVNGCLTQKHVNGVLQVMANRPYGRLYVDSENAEVLCGKMQCATLSRTSGSETSAHQVFFARVSGGAGNVPVAVKPFIHGGERMVAEWVNTLLARQRGYGAFEPLGIISTHEGGYMLSRRRDGVESLENTEWEGVLSGGVQSGDTRHARIMDVSRLLASLHHDGGIHGDPQLKNFVVSESGTLDVIDWEAAKFYGESAWMSTSDELVEGLVSAAVRDLKVLFGSLARRTCDHGVGLLDGYTPTVQWGYFRELVVDPYIKRRMTLLEEGVEESGSSIVDDLGRIEESIEQYIKSGELYVTLSRARRGE